VLREARTDDPNIIAIEVDTERAKEIFAGKESIKRFIARELEVLGAYAHDAPVRTTAG
jgi:pheromone shutdown protein TraB